MTTPVGDLQVVAAKFSGGVIFYLVMWLPLLACLFIVRHFTQPGDRAGLRQRWAAMYLGIFLVGGLFLSLGCLASSLTRSQMAAAMISFALGVSLFALGFVAPGAAGSPTEWQSQLVVLLSTCSTRWTTSRAAWWTRAR